MKESGSFIIGYDFSGTNEGVLIVGEQNKRNVRIINAFEGKTAYDLYLKLKTNKSETPPSGDTPAES